MGNPISSLREQLNQEKKEEAQMQERLNVLEKMITFHLENAKNEMLHGDGGDEEIHAGTVVEFSRQISITMTNKTSPKLQDVIGDFLMANYQKALKIL